MAVARCRNTADSAGYGHDPASQLVAVAFAAVVAAAAVFSYHTAFVEAAVENHIAGRTPLFQIRTENVVGGCERVDLTEQCALQYFHHWGVSSSVIDR